MIAEEAFDLRRLICVRWPEMIAPPFDNFIVSAPLRPADAFTAHVPRANARQTMIGVMGGVWSCLLASDYGVIAHNIPLLREFH